VAAFEIQEVFAATLEVLGQPCPGYAESEVDRAMCVRSPIPVLARTHRAGPFRDSTLNRVAIVPGQSEADGDLRVHARPVSLVSGGLVSHVGEVQAIRIGQRSDRWPPSWNTLAFYVESVSSSNNLSLQLRVRELEPVLHCQLDANPLELRVAMHRECAPLLRAQLQRGKDGLSAVAIVDVDHLAAIGEGRRAALIDRPVVDDPTVDHRLKRADIVGLRPLEGRPFKGWGLALSIPPLLRDVGTPFDEPFLEARESVSLPLQSRALPLLLVPKLRLLLRLPGSKLASSGIEKLLASSPRPSEHVSALGALAVGHPSPLLALPVARACPTLSTFPMVARAFLTAPDQAIARVAATTRGYYDISTHHRELLMRPVIVEGRRVSPEAILEVNVRRLERLERYKLVERISDRCWQVPPNLVEILRDRERTHPQHRVEIERLDCVVDRPPNRGRNRGRDIGR
jgi:hypothetical protein